MSLSYVDFFSQKSAYIFFTKKLVCTLSLKILCIRRFGWKHDAKEGGRGGKNLVTLILFSRSHKHNRFLIFFYQNSFSVFFLLKEQWILAKTLIIIIMIISVFKEDLGFSMTANLPYCPPINTDNCK